MRDEPFEARSGRVDHTERGVARARDERCGLDDALKDAVEREVGADGEPGFEKRAEARGFLCGHRFIVAERLIDVTTS